MFVCTLLKQNISFWAVLMLYLLSLESRPVDMAVQKWSAPHPINQLSCPSSQHQEMVWNLSQDFLLPMREGVFLPPPAFLPNLELETDVRGSWNLTSFFKILLGSSLTNEWIRLSSSGDGRRSLSSSRYVYLLEWVVRLCKNATENPQFCFVLLIGLWCP